MKHMDQLNVLEVGDRFSGRVEIRLACCRVEEVEALLTLAEPDHERICVKI